jgi:hypothetical protein
VDDETRDKIKAALAKANASAENSRATIERVDGIIGRLRREARREGYVLTPAGELVSRLRLIAERAEDNTAAAILLALHHYDVAVCPPDMAGAETSPLEALLDAGLERVRRDN